MNDRFLTIVENVTTNQTESDISHLEERKVNSNNDRHTRPSNVSLITNEYSHKYSNVTGNDTVIINKPNNAVTQEKQAIQGHAKLLQKVKKIFGAYYQLNGF